jgi:integrase
MRGTITKKKLKGGRISWGYVFDASRNENGKRRQVVKKGFITKHEAADALREALGDRGKGHIKEDTRTFAAFFNTWFEQHAAARWNKKTTEENRNRAAYAIRTFGQVSILKLDAMRLEQDFTTLLAKGGKKTAEHPEGRPLSPKTVREIAALVNQALDKAQKWGIIARNPMKDVERPSAHKKEVQIPEPYEYERFLDRVQGTRYYALSVFAAASGCRRGELLALKWSDIDPKTGVVTISKSVSETKAGLEITVTKSRKTRYVRVSRTTIEVLLEHKRELEREKALFGADYKQNDLIFPKPDGDFYKPDQVTGRISEFMQKAGIDASLHSLRHLHASLMLSKHVPITVVSKRLGHANSQITLDVYAHAMKNDEVTASELWDDATAEIIGRTQKPSRKESAIEADVIFRDPKTMKIASNR